MRSSRKVIILCLIFMLISGLIPSVGAVEVSKSVDESKLEFIAELEFMEPDDAESFGAERYFRRDELAVLACNLLNIQPSDIKAEQSLYTDMTGATENAGYIKAAVDSGLMLLDNEGKFWPNETVTTEDALRIFVTIQGAKVFLEIHDPVSAGIRTGILKGNVPGGKLTKGQIAELLYDTLHAEYYEQIVFGEQEQYKQSEKSLTLEALFGIVYGTGIVDGASGTTLIKADESLLNGEILIDGVQYIGKTISEYLGYKVDYYYKKATKNADVREIIYMKKNYSYNKTVKIDTELIHRVEDDLIEYYDSENTSKKKQIKIPGAIDFIYNGIAHPTWTKEDLKPGFGNVTFIDNDGKSGYDVVMVENITFMVIGYFDGAELKLYDRSNGEVKDFGGDNVFYEVRKEDGSAGTLGKDIRVKRLVGIMESKNTVGCKKITFWAGDSDISGEITKIKGQEICIGDYNARISDYLYNDMDKSVLKLGNSISAYVWKDKIVRIERPVLTDKAVNVAYLVDVAKNDSPFDEEIRFRLMKENASFEDVDGAKRIKLDGKSYSSPYEVYDRLAETAKLSVKYNSKYPFAQPVQIWKNSDGQIYKIDTMYYDSSKETETTSLVPKIAGAQARFNAPNRSYYYTATKTFMVTVPTTTPVFWIPINHRYDEAFYGYVVSGGIGEDTKDVEPFFVDKCDSAGVLFIYYTPITIVGNGAVPGIVTEVSLGMDDEGDIVKKIAYVDVNGNESELSLSENTDDAQIDVGDVIRWRTNYAGETTVLDKTLDVSEIPAIDERTVLYEASSGVAAGAIQRGYGSVYGTVLARENGVISLTTSIKSDTGGIETMVTRDNFLTSTATKYFKLENFRGTPRVVSKDFNSLISYDMNPDEASEVYMYILNGVVRIVYENAFND